MPPSTCTTISKRICQEGHANALALNKDCTQIAVAGRSRKKRSNKQPLIQCARPTQQKFALPPPSQC